MEIFNRLTETSRKVLQEYIEKHASETELNCSRFFSYGSNMNEEKFRKDTKENGYEFGLDNVEIGVLQNYRRTLGNKSTKHGLAFTISFLENEKVEGICHDVPLKGLEAFLKKEGLLAKKPSYKLEILTVAVSGRNVPAITLIGIKPWSIEKLDCDEKLKAYCYVCKTITGAKSWKVYYEDLEKIKNELEIGLCRKMNSWKTRIRMKVGTLSTILKSRKA